MDTNPPDDDHWWYDAGRGKPPRKDFAFLGAAAGDSKEAENLDWLLQTPETMALPLGTRAARAAACTTSA
jgi:hypothetical protein